MIGVGEVALLLQQCYIIVFGTTIIYPRYCVHFITVMYCCCKYHASYFAIGSIFGDINNRISVVMWYYFQFIFVVSSWM